MGIAEFIIAPAEGRTRWLHPSYALFEPIERTGRCPIAGAKQTWNRRAAVSA